MDKSWKVNDIISELSGYSYDEVYSILSTIESGIVFCKREIKPDKLSWKLPPGNWTPLSAATEPLKTQVRQHFDTCCQAVETACRDNRNLAKAVLTVPSDDHIFFCQQSDDSIDLAMVAWGYKFPTRPIVVPPEGNGNEHKEKQDVSLCFIYDGQRMPDMAFTINEQNRSTPANGLYHIGMFKVGEQYPIVLDDGTTFTLTVEKGRDIYEFDITKWFEIEVEAVKDGKPYSGASCTITYNGNRTTTTTDADGHVTLKLPLALKETECSAIIDGQRDKKMGEGPKTTLHLEFTSLTIEVEAIKDGKPYANAGCSITYNDQQATVTTDDNGHAQVVWLMSTIPSDCTAVIDDQKQSKQATSPTTILRFEFTTPPPPPEPPKMIRIRLLGYNGMPLPELDFTVKTKNGELHGVTDAEGYATFPASEFKDGEKPKINFKVSKEYQQRHDIYAKPKKK